MALPVRQEIYSSWQRSMLAGLRPDKFEVPYLPDADEAGPLAWAASPIIDQTAEDLDGSRAGLILTDARGHVVARKTPGRDILNRFDRIALAPGFVYSEDQIGTNAIGTAIARRGPSVVTADEHFAGALARMACAAAPVMDAAGELIGVVDLTCAAEDFHPLMLPLAKRVALEISQRFGQARGASAASRWASLSPAQRAVAEQISQGLTKRAVASNMLLTPDAVDEHLRQIFRTLGIGTRLELARAAEAAAVQSRTIEAVDNVRRRIERDLHDGIQQQLIALGLQVRAAGLTIPTSQSELKGELTQVASGLLDVLDNVRQIARGIHPAILSERGLEPAVRTLARHSPVPVHLAIRLPGRLPERAETGAYYIAAEALTNVAKHARATSAEICIEENEGSLILEVRDDGVGGADPDGAGLTGLRERAASLGGCIELSSPRSGGTRLTAKFPVR